MAYFLKKSNRKKGMHLQIYESFYHHEKKETAHRSYQALGYVEDLIASGIPDPVSHYSDVVKKMNRELSLLKQQEKARQISSSPERFLGYFLVKNLYDSLHVSKVSNPHLKWGLQTVDKVMRGMGIPRIIFLCSWLATVCFCLLCHIPMP